MDFAQDFAALIASNFFFFAGAFVADRLRMVWMVSLEWLLSKLRRRAEVLYPIPPIAGDCLWHWVYQIQRTVFRLKMKDLYMIIRELACIYHIQRTVLILRRICICEMQCMQSAEIRHCGPRGLEIAESSSSPEMVERCTFGLVCEAIGSLPDV